MTTEQFPSLFKSGMFMLHSGQVSTFKIDCDALTARDRQAIAAVIGPKLVFSKVIGVPRGGLAFAQALEPYATGGEHTTTLIVDDVLTTGGSMEEVRKQVVGPVVGIVPFSRGTCPSWVYPKPNMFGLWRETP